MAKRRFASKFYNCSYDSLVPVGKAPADRLIPCTVYGEITKETVAELKDRFAFLEAIYTPDGKAGGRQK